MKLAEKLVTVTTQYGEMPAFSVRPDTSDACPPVILYMDAGGYREELCNFARRIAEQGYFCILPDLYYRVGMLRFDLSRRTEATAAVVRAAMAGLKDADIAEDTGSIIAWLDGHAHAASGPIGCIGYCMSGRYVVIAAARYPERIAAAASLYGVGLVREDAESPHLSLGDVKAELYFGFAENDPLVPPNVVPTLRSSLERHKVPHLIEVFPGTKHGFCFPEDPRYTGVAAEQAWGRVFALWKRALSE